MLEVVEMVEMVEMAKATEMVEVAKATEMVEVAKATEMVEAAKATEMVEAAKAMKTAAAAKAKEALWNAMHRSARLRSCRLGRRTVSRTSDTRTTQRACPRSHQCCASRPPRPLCSIRWPAMATPQPLPADGTCCRLPSRRAAPRQARSLHKDCRWRRRKLQTHSASSTCPTPRATCRRT